MSIIRRVGVTVLCTVAALAFSASAAGAGEVTGKGKFIAGDTDAPLKGNSICAYSGQNDGYFHPEEAESEQDALTRVQSYGQAVRSGEPIPAFLHPGAACNGHTGFLAGGGEG